MTELGEYKAKEENLTSEISELRESMEELEQDLKKSSKKDVAAEVIAL